MRTYRQIFGQFRKSSNGKLTKELLYSQQLRTCCGCHKYFEMRDLELHHLIPVKELEQREDLINLTAISNLVLLCRTCNAKQGAKIDSRFT